MRPGSSPPSTARLPRFCVCEMMGGAALVSAPLQKMRCSAALLFLLTIACERELPQGELIEGESAGATFLVRLAERLPGNERADVEGIVGDALERVRSKVSADLPESDLSRLQTADAGVEVPVSVETFEVLREAVRVSDLTGGAFDVTGAPLARLWGFGPGGHTEHGSAGRERDRARARPRRVPESGARRRFHDRHEAHRFARDRPLGSSPPATPSTSRRRRSRSAVTGTT